MMNWQRLGKLTLVGVLTFAVIWTAAAWLAVLTAPHSTLGDVVIWAGSMFAVTGAVLAVVIWVAKDRAYGDR